MPVLAVDHGEKRIGIAVSDTTNTLARPLTILKHISRETDARRVRDLALKHDVSTVVVGQSTDEEGNPNPAGRRARRFAEMLASMTDRIVLLWDESLTTQDARSSRIAAGVARKRRAAHIDAEAAAVLLQSYLDASGHNGARAEKAAGQ